MRFTPSRLLAAAIPAIVLATACARNPAPDPAPAPVPQAAAGTLPSIASKTRGLPRMDGFMPIYWDESAGKLWLEIPAPGTELLYLHSMPAGLGSNDIGLDRSQLGGTRLVRFQRVGPRVLMVQPNLAFRASSENAAERRAVEESFAQSVLWGFTAVAESDGRVLVDATEFALRDVHDVVGALRQANQGTFRLDASRSALYPPRTKAFPRNTEIEVTLTFTGDQPGRFVREVAPTAESFTVRQRHSFVALPEPGYEPREADPRAGFFGISYRDYSAPIAEPIVKRFIARHRLEKKDPAAAVSDAVEPIVYYLDAGVPEPVRSALLDGARWWNEAFEAAGYRNAFRVEILPDTADPMDVRYHVIQWVHRSTRGWSYGSSVTDPRTGEIIKGHVLLGSLRVRQDYLLAEGLLSPYESGDETPPAMREMALARLRQLSAHEVGHTLGIAHNYIASTSDRASVMDYPHPLVRLTADGRIDLSDAYTARIGEWDKLAVLYGYQDFPAGTDEKAALDAILDAGRARGLFFLSDADARPTGSAHPLAHLWDNAADASAELSRMLRVRRVALERFGERAIRRNMPMATIEEALVPLYLHHRYQTEAAVKALGGLYYSYALRGDRQEVLRRVPAAEQLRALDAVMATLRPAELALPAAVLRSIPPRPYGYPAHRELFSRTTGLAFDALTPAAVAADMTIGLLLDRERAARLVEQNALDSSLPSLQHVIDRIAQVTFDGRARNGYEAAILRAEQRVLVDELMQLAEVLNPQVRAVASFNLDRLRRRAATAAGDDAERAHRFLLAQDIQRFLERPAEPARRLPAAPGSPPGAPIGQPDLHPLLECDGG